jgi:type IV pilus assembly protein PilA
LSRGFTLVEMMVVMGIVAILALMTVPTYMEKAVREQVSEALPLADIAKGPIAAAWALALPLPADNEAAGLPAADKIVSNYVSSVSVQGGAIHIVFGNRASSVLKGKVLSLRAAVVDDARVVPVTWVCGNAAAPDKMAMKGANKTDLPNLFLPVKCR